MTLCIVRKKKARMHSVIIIINWKLNLNGNVSQQTDSVLWRRFSPIQSLFNVSINFYSGCAKVLPLVTFVKWNNGACSAPSGETGSCLQSAECQLRGGIAGGQCAGGKSELQLCTVSTKIQFPQAMASAACSWVRCHNLSRWCDCPKSQHGNSWLHKLIFDPFSKLRRRRAWERDIFR